MKPVYWIWLSQCFSTGSNLPAELCRVMGGAEEIFRAKPEEIPKLKGLHKNHLEALAQKSLDSAQRVVEQCQSKKIGILTWGQEEYPSRLRNIYGPPMVLYYLGDVSLFHQPVSIGMVGSRSSSSYGLNVAGALSYELARQGIVVVSGCAVGGDSAAHSGALQAGGMTIGVEACGLDVDYPKDNTKLRRMIARKGLLLSELEPGRRPSASYFSVRNRLISGLSDGVVVTEAPQRSGCLLTARLALEQNRELFCVPPRNIFSRACSGVVEYLRDGAKPVFGVEDILSEFQEDLERADLRLPTPPSRTQPPQPIPDTLDDPNPAPAQPKPHSNLGEAARQLSGVPQKVYQSLNGVMQANELAEVAREDAGKVIAALTELELDGLVEHLGGGRYQKR